MKVQAQIYASNPYYLLLIHLLIKFRITDFTFEKEYQNKLNAEAKQEIFAIQRANLLLEKYPYPNNPIAIFELSEVLSKNIKGRKDVEAQKEASENARFPKLKTLIKYSISNRPIVIDKRLPQGLKEYLYELTDMPNLTDVPELAFTVIEALSFIRKKIHLYLKLLIKNIILPASVAEWDKKAISIIHLACAFGDKKIVSLLLSKNPKRIYFQDRITKAQPIHYALVQNNFETFKILLEHAAALSLFPNRTTPLLYYAAKQGYSEILKKILSVNNEGINAFNNKLKTALHMACHFGHVECTKVLANAPGVSIDARDHHGRTPLHLASRTNEFRCSQVLLNAGANITKDDYGQTALHLACINDSRENVRLLLAKLKDDSQQINSQDNDGCTSLHVACEAGHVEVVRELLNTGVINIFIKDIEGRTALHKACTNNHLEVVETLLNNSPKLVNAQDNKGYAPLHIACKQGYIQLQEILLKYQAIPIIFTKKFYTPLSLIKKIKNKELRDEMQNTLVSYIKIPLEEKIIRRFKINNIALLTIFLSSIMILLSIIAGSTVKHEIGQYISLTVDITAPIMIACIPLFFLNERYKTKSLMKLQNNLAASINEENQLAPYSHSYETIIARINDQEMQTLNIPKIIIEPTKYSEKDTTESKESSANKEINLAEVIVQPVNSGKEEMSEAEELAEKQLQAYRYH